MASLLHEQNELALSANGMGGRFLAYRSAALANIASATMRTSHHGDRHTPWAPPSDARGASGSSRSTSARPEQHLQNTYSQAEGRRQAAAAASPAPRSVSQLPPDIEAVALKPPGHAEPNFANATVDATSGGVTAQAAVGERQECNICGRMFTEDRIAAHVKVCAKANSGERKVFNAQERRVRDTYAKNNAEEDADRAIRLASDPAHDSKIKSKRPSWRQQSSALQHAMRSIREPGSVPEVEDMRIECAGCGRRFAAETAETHIPKCIEKARTGRR